MASGNGSSKQFLRRWRVQVGTHELADLDIIFEVKRDLGSKPNGAVVKVHNLSPSSRAYMTSQPHLPLIVEAGYQDHLAQIYSGITRHVLSQIDGPTVTTTITSGDGEVQYQAARMYASIPAFTSQADVLSRLVSALGVRPGNLDLVRARLVGRPPIHTVDTAIVGNVSDELDRFTEAAGLEWSVQSGAMQILDSGGALEPTTILLSAATGLVESPSVDSKGILEARCLLNPDIRPGKIVVLDSMSAKGGYRITHVEHVGETNGHDWYTTLHGRAY